MNSHALRLSSTDLKAFTSFIDLQCMQKALFCYNFNSFFVSYHKVDGLCYLLQEIYGIENKINQKSGKVSVSAHDSCHVGATHFPRLLAWSRVVGLLLLVKGDMLARITVLFSCENTCIRRTLTLNIHCTLILPLSTGSLVHAWELVHA